MGIAAVIGTLTNTVLCLGAIVLLYGNELNILVKNLVELGGVESRYMNDGGAWLVGFVGVPNGLAEMVVAALLVPLIKTAADAINRRGRGARRPAPVKADAPDAGVPTSADVPETIASVPTEPVTNLEAMPDAAMTAAETAVENAAMSAAEETIDRR